LILVPEPYFNEPGYEAMLGTDKGKYCSKSYNEDILLQTIIHAMVAQLRRPSPGFEDVIRAHFWIKKKLLLKVRTRL
jgi:baculoviral IAP repeat-containing protein 6